jgi:hypothetical protein
LDGPVPQGRRVVDLAYATTGHKAQGLTRWRALVRITGQEDANWLYVQLSRAREDTRLHTIVTPEPHAGASEIDLPDREPPDAYAQLAAALARPGGQRLAIDTNPRLDVRATSTTELRAERDRLQADLDQAPPDRRRVLERAIQRREQAEQQLAATEAKHPGEDGRRWFGRQHAEQRQDPAARALAVRQAERAAKAEVQARTAQQQHQAWMEDHHEDGHSYREVARELALRSRQRVAFAELQQPTYLANTLGPVPESVRGRRAWRQTARQVEDYRQRFQISDTDRPLGPQPARDQDDPERQQAWRQATSAIQRLQARRQQRDTDRDNQQRGLDRDPTPGSLTSIADHKQSTGRHAAARDPDLSESPPMLPAPAPSAGRERGGSYGTPGGSALGPLPASPRPRMGYLRPHPAAAAGRRHRRRRTDRHPDPRRRPPAGWAGRRAGRWRGRLAAAVPRLGGDQGVAVWRAGGAAHRAPPPQVGPCRLDVLHDLAIPHSRANGDHLLIGPPGVFLIDSKAWHGTITLAGDGSAWHNGHPLDQTLATVRWEAQQLATTLGVPVLPLLCVHDTRIPWDEIYVDSVPVLTPARMLALLRSLEAHLDQVGVMLLAEHVRHQLHPAT